MSCRAVSVTEEIGFFPLLFMATSYRAYRIQDGDLAFTVVHGILAITIHSGYMVVCAKQLQVYNSASHVTSGSHNKR